MNKEKILNCLEGIKIKINQIEEELKLETIEIKTKSKKEKLELLLNSNDWPSAVLEFQIVDENLEEEKIDRAEGVVDILLQEELKNKKFLDFGCGEGHMAKYASTQETTLSIGYDIQKSEKSQLNWEVEENNLLLTTNLEKVKEKSPYDIILIYDVLDHTKQNPVDLLNQAKSLLSDTGNIYLRCHPWCGRHGGHLYRKTNKAFIHVVFSDDELKELGLEPEKMIKVKLPMKTYEDYIKASGLKIQSKDIETQDVEDFFEKTPEICDRLKQVMNIDNGKTFPKHQLSQCFHDYILTK
jgi:2-polyprenyl-3-methyl-5-hydroxy-6-metoxy-1,4-benzoquinol methylase